MVNITYAYHQWLKPFQTVVNTYDFSSEAAPCYLRFGLICPFKWYLRAEFPRASKTFRIKQSIEWHYSYPSQPSCLKQLERDTPQLIALYRQKVQESRGPAEILRIYDLQEQHEVHMRCHPTLRGLPVNLLADD
ncbi:uncharacterized protein LOC123958056 isoform X1 [Micropterus dolomieu]|uniref:uncharacterized protein LOC123958056 isoform X1 n=1 Tax=Micropterus dolomieu TaxID=147949 RepID=UPI001E8DE399|nr:uncharacterized protein LOC123958056 isoform X1 [Micropterus dolomieu]